MDSNLPQTIHSGSNRVVAVHSAVHPLLDAAGDAGRISWAEFFSAQLRNPNTRTAYHKAVIRFLDWVAERGIPLIEIEPGMVGEYFDLHSGSTPTKKLALSALRNFFDRLVNRHIVVMNPCHSVCLERHQVIEGKTPEITVSQARHLLQSISTRTVIGLRDRAIIGVLIYTAARSGAVTSLARKDFLFDGTQYYLCFDEKGGKQREIPVQHNLQGYITEYIAAAELDTSTANAPLFRAFLGRTRRITEHPMSTRDLQRMIKRRLLEAGLPNRISTHSFRVCTITDLLTQGVPLEDVSFLAGHIDPRTTRLYDRRQRRITRNIVERISV